MSARLQAGAGVSGRCCHFQVAGSASVGAWIRGGLAADPAQLVVSGQEPPDVGGQFVAADRDWCGGGLQRVLHDGLVPAGDEQDAEVGASTSASPTSASTAWT